MHLWWLISAGHYILWIFAFLFCPNCSLRWLIVLKGFFFYCAARSYSVNSLVWQFDVGWLQWCPDPQNQPQGLGAAPGPAPGPTPHLDLEVVLDPDQGNIVTGRLYFMNHHCLLCFWAFVHFWGSAYAKLGFQTLTIQTRFQCDTWRSVQNILIYLITNNILQMKSSFTLTGVMVYGTVEIWHVCTQSIC